MVTRARLALDPLEARRRAIAALELLDGLPAPDVSLRVEALTALAGARAALGEGLDPRLVEEALAAEALAPPTAVSDRFSAALGPWLKYQGDFDGARTWLRRTRDAAVAEGDEGSLPFALSHLPQLELWTGDWDAAAAAATEHLTVAEWTGQEEQRLTAIYSLALVDAHAGRLDEASRLIAETLPDAEELDQWNVYQLLSVLGFVELSAGRPAVAVPPLRRAEEIYESYGVGEIAAVHENLAEALVDADDLDAADRALVSYLERAERLQRPMALAALYRSMGLLHAGRGELADASRAVETALQHEDRAGVPFSRARTLLVAGRVARRTGQRRAARRAIEEAIDGFARLGARAWEGRARAELDRLPGRRPAGSERLTPTETRVAQLVARGRTNRQVAAELFVTPKTVESNLTRIYAKLGVRSRAELAATLGRALQDPAEL